MPRVGFFGIKEGKISQKWHHVDFPIPHFSGNGSEMLQNPHGAIPEIPEVAKTWLRVGKLP